MICALAKADFSQFSHSAVILSENGPNRGQITSNDKCVVPSLVP
jgi:hypothetical protein